MDRGEFSKRQDSVAEDVRTAPKMCAQRRRCAHSAADRMRARHGRYALYVYMLVLYTPHTPRVRRTARSILRIRRARHGRYALHLYMYIILIYTPHTPRVRRTARSILRIRRTRHGRYALHVYIYIILIYTPHTPRVRTAPQMAWRWEGADIKNIYIYSNLQWQGRPQRMPGSMTVISRSPPPKKIKKSQC